MRNRGVVPDCIAIGFAAFVVWALLIELPALGQTDRMPRIGQGDLVVYEGVGLGKLRLGDPAERVEQLLGKADGGSERHREYLQLGLHIQLHEDKVYTILFQDRFPGTLLTSGLRIGDTLLDLERAYGPILQRREVADHNAWTLDRILLVREAAPQSESGDASKIEFYDLGMAFFLDEQGRIVHFRLSKYTGYALRSPDERVRVDDARAGVPTATRDERLARWKASTIRDWGVRIGVGFAELEFGDPAARVESLLGPPDSGSERMWSYRELGIKLAFTDGRVSGFFFHEGRPKLYFTGSFPGKLVESGIGIGDRLEDVEGFYGIVLERRRVKDTSETLPSRVLGVCDGCTAYSAGESSRLSYDDLYLYFNFDEQERIVGFGLSRACPSAKPAD